jgi:MATE family multidrug resistance protein
MIARLALAQGKLKRDADRRIWRVAGPTMLANISGALVGIVDIWAIGHLGSEAPLAGLAVGAFFMINLYVLFSFLYMSTIGLVAQSFGLGRRRQITEVTMRAMVMAAGLGLLLVLLSPVIREVTVNVWNPSPEAAVAAHTYLRIRMLSAPAIFISMTVKGFLIGTQRARISLYLDLFLNALNTVLTVTLVFGLGWGVAGAATGNLIAEWGAAVAGGIWLGYLIRPARVAAIVRRAGFWRLGSFREQASINTFLFMRTLFVQIVFAIMSVSGARLGDDVLAANHVLLQLIFVATLAIVGMSNATQTLVGEAKGAGNRALFHFWSARTALWSFIVGMAMTFAYGIGGRAIIAAFTNVEGVRAAADQQLYLVALWPVLAVWSYQLDGIFIGATSAKPMVWGAGVGASVFVVAQWLLVPSLGNEGLWIAFILFFLTRGMVLAACYAGLAYKIGPVTRV